MKKFKKIIAMCLTAVMSLSVMSIGAFAAEEPSIVNSYTTEDGVKVTIFDPDISVEFSEKNDQGITTMAAPITGYIYINKPNSEGLGAATQSFVCNGNARAKFGLDYWEGGPYYNVSLYRVGVGNAPDSLLALCEDVPENQEATLQGLTSTGSYYFRVSTYYTPGEAGYYAYAL
jgi:hypothetical protein